MNISGLDGSAGKTRTEDDLTSLPANDFDDGNSSLEEADESIRSANRTAVGVEAGTISSVGVREAVGVAVAV